MVGQAASTKDGNGKKESFQDNCLLDHEITDELRARVTERQQKDAANDKKRRTTAERKQRKLAVMDRQVPWSMFDGKKAWADIENTVEGYILVVSRHMAQQGIEVLGSDHWAQADVLAVFRLEEGQASRQDHLPDSLGRVLVVEHHRGHG